MATTPLSTPTGDLLATLTSPTLRLDYARSLTRLRKLPSEQSTALPTHPLAVFLFLIDSLVYLRSSGVVGARLGAERRASREAVRAGQGIDGGDEMNAAEDGRDGNGALAPGSLTREKEGNKGIGAEGSESENDWDAWEDWRGYIAEMVRLFRGSLLGYEETGKLIP